MARNLRKFVNPQFLRSVDPALIARLLDRHRHALIGLDIDALRAAPEAAGDALTAFFAGPEEGYPAGLVADLHRIAELGNAKGLRLILAQSGRLGLSIAPEPGRDGNERRQDAKHVALRVFLDHPAVFDAASDMLALAARSSLDEYAGLTAGVEVDRGEPARAAFTSQLAAMLEADLCGSYCRLGWYADGDEVNLVISHGSIVKTTPIVKHDEERVVTYRDAEQAVLSYSAATGRLTAKQYRGHAFDRLLAAGVLEELAPAEEWSACAGCDCAYGYRPIQRIGGRIVAACPIDAGADTELEEDDLRAFRVDAARLLSLVARASRIPDPVEPIAPGLWRLGLLPSGGAIIVALPARVLLAPGAVLHHHGSRHGRRRPSPRAADPLSLFNTRGFGLATRLADNKAEEAWIVSVHPSAREAQCAEQVLSCRYGIPTTHWEVDGWIKTPERQRSPELIAAIYAGLDLSALQARATLLLRDHRLERDHPLITGGEGLTFSRRATRMVRACNVFAEIMQIPKPTEADDFAWVTVTGNDATPFSGPDYSMDVDRDLHYVADGLVTHKCWYAVKKTGKGHWAGDRKQTTLWQIPSRDQDADTVHGTQKPVECMRRPILNNSSPGQAVFEPFMGLGTTLSRRRPRARLSQGRAQPGLCRCRNRALAAVHRQGGRARGFG